MDYTNIPVHSKFADVSDQRAPESAKSEENQEKLVLNQKPGPHKNIFGLSSDNDNHKKFTIVREYKGMVRHNYMTFRCVIYSMRMVLLTDNVAEKEQLEIAVI